ncbi:MAG TPA: DUF190 domain-containing protein [Elusimicrobiota bacterium]|nr:DUF190 domain-containing protein [Elusimicrobiota bacterium]
MKLEGEQKLLRVFVGEQDRWEGRPLYEAIVDEARARRLAGATALKGFMGFGRNAHLHTVKILELSEDLPVVVEIVDSEDKIQAFLPRLDEMVKEGLITMEQVHVIAYRAEGKGRAKKA